jgi:hypothetical protein
MKLKHKSHSKPRKPVGSQIDSIPQNFNFKARRQKLDWKLFVETNIDLIIDKVTILNILDRHNPSQFVSRKPHFLQCRQRRCYLFTVESLALCPNLLKVIKSYISFSSLRNWDSNTILHLW